jgi:hypothetical protein
VDRDAAAYDTVVAAFRLPKNTDDEKTARTNAIQYAMKTATDVPLDTMKMVARAIAAAVPVAQYGNPSALSDIAVGVQLLGSAVGGGLLNVQANIGSVKDAAYVERTTSEIRSVTASMMEHTRAVYQSPGFQELMKKGAELSGSGHHGPPSPDQLVKSLAGLLRHIGTADTKRALEVLAQSADAAMKAAASDALVKFPNGPSAH